jgi:hypothetical protein
MERWGHSPRKLGTPPSPKGEGDDPGRCPEQLDGRMRLVGYHGPRRIRLVAYGARLERGLG